MDDEGRMVKKVAELHVINATWWWFVLRILTWSYNYFQPVCYFELYNCLKKKKEKGQSSTLNTKINHPPNQLTIVVSLIPTGYFTLVALCYIDLTWVKKPSAYDSKLALETNLQCKFNPYTYSSIKALSQMKWSLINVLAPFIVWWFTNFSQRLICLFSEFHWIANGFVLLTDTAKLDTCI